MKGATHHSPSVQNSKHLQRAETGHNGAYAAGHFWRMALNNVL